MDAKKKIDSQSKLFNTELQKTRIYSSGIATDMSDIYDYSVSMTLQFRDLVSKLQSVSNFSTKINDKIVSSLKLNAQFDTVTSAIYQTQQRALKETQKLALNSLQTEFKGKNLKEEELDVILQTRDLISDLASQRESINNKLLADKEQQIHDLATEINLQKNLLTTSEEKEELDARQVALVEAIQKNYSEQLSQLDYILDSEKSITENLVDQASIRTRNELQLKKSDAQKRILGNLGAEFELLEEIGINLKGNLLTVGAIAGAITLVYKGTHLAFESLEELRKSGLGIHQSVDGVTKSIGIWNVLGIDTTKIQASILDQLGDQEEVSRNLIQTAAKQSLYYGASEESIGALYGKFAKIPGITTKIAQDTVDLAGHLSEAAHVAPGKVLQSMADNSKAFAMFGGISTKNLVTMAVNAQKIGVSFDKITGNVDHLLDFESRINQQFEASILLGKNINLDKAASLANSGEILESTKEIVRQLGTEAEFNKLNYLQKKSLAEATGFELEDLAALVKNQDKLNNLSDGQIEKLKESGDIMGVLKETTAGINTVTSVTLEGLSKWGPAILTSLGPITQLIGKLKIAKVLSIGEAIASAWKAALSSPASLITGGLAGAAIAAIVTSQIMSSTEKAHDAVIDPSQGMVVSGPRGSIQLDKDDSIIAGTNLGGNGAASQGAPAAQVDLQPLISAMNELISLVKKGSIITMDGKKVGEALVLATPRNQFVTNNTR